MSKRVIIIGATSGIGKKVAEGYISRGWKVGVAGRRTEELEPPIKFVRKSLT